MNINIKANEFEIECLVEEAKENIGSYDWEDAVEEEYDELGYFNKQYISDWDDVVETAKENMDDYNDKLNDEIIFLAKEKYQQYLTSDRWFKIRLFCLKRDEYKCVDCDCKSTEVHHLTYKYKNKPEETKYCISLCNSCHKKRHDIK